MLGLLINAIPETRVIANADHIAAACVFSLLNILVLVLVILASRDGDHGRDKSRAYGASGGSFEAPAYSSGPSLKRLVKGLVSRCLE